MLHAVIGESAAHSMKIVVALLQRFEEFIHGVDLDVGCFPQAIAEGIQNVGTVDHEGLVGPKGGIDFGFKIESCAGLMMGQRIGRIIGRSDGVDLEAFEETVGTKVFFSDSLVGGVPDFLCGVRIEQSVDSEAAP